MRFEETIGISHVLRLVDHAMKRRLDRALGAHDLTAAQYMALSALESRGALTNAELARECSVTPQTSNRLIEGLVREGLIKRREDPEHGRKLSLELAKKARALICAAHVDVDRVEREALRGFNKTQNRAVLDALRRLLDNLGDDGA